MSDMTELPEWVWTLLDAITDYEDTHPLLYRLDDVVDGVEKYQRAECFGAFLGAHKAWPPREVQHAAEFRRHVLREARAETS